MKTNQSSNTTAQCYRFIVTGCVQGVYFRQSTVDQARQLGLNGWVRNLTDGRVEGLAGGEPQALETLRTWLRHGPPAARVDDLQWVTVDESPGTGFEVRR